MSGAKRIVTAEDDPIAPFGNEPTLDTTFELDGVNYALYEGLRELDDAKRKTFDNEAHQCVWSALQSFNIPPQNIHVRIGPGTISAVLLRYQAGMYPTLLDADWTMRLHVTIRTAKNNSDILKGLAAYSRSTTAFSGLLRAYQTLFDRIVEKVTVSIVEDPIQATHAVRDVSRSLRSGEHIDPQARSTRTRKYDPEAPELYDDAPESRVRRSERRSASRVTRQTRNPTTRMYSDDDAAERWRSDSDDFGEDNRRSYREERHRPRRWDDDSDDTEFEYERAYVDRNRSSDRYYQREYDRQRPPVVRDRAERSHALVPTSRRYRRDDWSEESNDGRREMTRRSHTSRSPGREFYLKVTECEPFDEW